MIYSVKKKTLNYYNVDNFCIKAKKKLNWKPYWFLNTALVEIVDWYQFCSKINFNKTQVQNKCFEQIKKYSNLDNKFF